MSGPRRFGVVAGIAGLLFVVLYAAPLALLPPSPTTGPADIAEYYVRNQPTLQLIQILRGLSVPLFFVFLSGLVSMLGGIEGDASRFTDGAAAAGAAFISVALAVLAARWSISSNAAQLASPPVVQAVRDLADAAQTFTVLPAAAFIGLASWVLCRATGALRGIGIAGVVFALLLLAGLVAGAFGLPGAAVTFLTPLWYVAVGLRMIFRGTQAEDLRVSRAT